MNSTTFLRLTFTGYILLSALFSPSYNSVKSVQAQSGTEWSEPINLSKSGASSEPSIVVDNTGVIHVIWVDAVDGYKYVQSKDGITWSSPVTVAFPFDPEEDFPPKLIADESGLIHMFWMKKPNERSEEDEPLALNYARTLSTFFSQPLSWAVVDEVIADSVLDFYAIADARSVIHLGYVSDVTESNQPAGLYYRRLDDLKWGQPVPLYSSQYFRTLSLEDSHVRLAVAGGGRTADIYVVWDDRPSKRIFMAKSPDGGVKWEETIQLKGPEDVLGLALPFNVTVSVNGENVLLAWQSGEPGFLCSQYSQWSTDGGHTFTNPIRISSDLTTCPTSGMFVGKSSKYHLMMLDLLGDLSLTAWNGSDWSLLHPQSELSAFTDPFTLNNVVLGCRNVTQRADVLYVVGCDQTGNLDIWFISRKIGAIEDWFPSPSTWSGPVELFRVTQEISSSTAVVDDKGLHLMWTQYLPGEDGKSTTTIQYASWKAGKWSRPTNIITDLDGIPQQLTAAFDEQGGVLLTWVKGVNGDIFFTRAEADKAYLASEWAPALRVSSLSELNTTPELLADSNNRIAMVYAIPYNENRGIYLIRSDDLGRNWSQPFKMFDAVAMGWDSVTAPKLEISEDGHLHLLVTRVSFREGIQEASLYYLQSVDGGATWTSPELVNEHNIGWSDIVYVGNNILYRLWNETSDERFNVFSEISTDGGLTWGGALKISAGEGAQVMLTLNKDANGQLYLMQSSLVESSIVTKEIHWDGLRWNTQDTKTVTLSQIPDQFSASSAITTDRVLHLVLSVVFEGVDDSVENEIIGYRRSLGPLNDLPLAQSLIIPAPSESVLIATPTVSVVETGPTFTSPLEGIQEASNIELRNRVGLSIVAGVVVLTIIYFLASNWRKSR